MEKVSDTGARVQLEGAVLKGADFSDRSILQFTSVGSRLSDARFDRARIHVGSFGAGQAVSTYESCSFDDAVIYFGPGGYARFVGCSFHRARLTNWICHAVEVVNCVFDGRIETAVFNGTVPTRDRLVVGRDRNEFVDNDFSGAQLVDVAFRTGIDLARQRLPVGPDYFVVPRAREGLARARKAIGSWKQADRRGQALAHLSALEFESQGGQDQLFFRLSDYDSTDADVVRELAEMLRPKGVG
ncbi:MAG: hypothetical protein WEB67_09105 [Acidimicrobiia bacterium]